MEMETGRDIKSKHRGGLVHCTGSGGASRRSWRTGSHPPRLPSIPGVYEAVFCLLSIREHGRDEPHRTWNRRRWCARGEVIPWILRATSVNLSSWPGATASTPILSCSCCRACALSILCPGSPFLSQHADEQSLYCWVVGCVRLCVGMNRENVDSKSHYLGAGVSCDIMCMML